MAKPKVSVVIPVYNAEKHLKSCVNSVLSQTLEEIEVILVDDGSTDSSGGICDFFGKDPRVKVIHQKNSGPSDARNAGMEIAGGEFIGFADADDSLDPGMYAMLYAAAVSSNADIAFCDYVLSEKNSRRYIKSDASDMAYGKNEIRSFIIPYFFGYDTDEICSYKNLCPIAGYSSYLWLCIYKTSVIRENGLKIPSQKLYYNEDNLFNLIFFSHADKAVHIAKHLYFYNTGGDSLTKRFCPGFMDAKIRRYRYLENYINENRLDVSFRERLKNKICVESINIINYYVLSGDMSLNGKYAKIGEILKNEVISNALQNLDIKHIGASPVSVFLFLEKHRLYPLILLFSGLRGLMR